MGTIVSSLDDEAGDSTGGVKGMRRRHGTTFVLLLVAVGLSFALGGCSTEGVGEDSELPPQEGLEIGDIAPDFRMQSQDQVTVALKDYAGTKNVVLVFYPADFTPV